MLMSDCRDKITNKLPMLTKTERKVADYVLGDYDNILKYTVADLARNAEVSDAAVVRFCQSVGFRGYQDFKMSVAGDVIPQEKQLDPTLDKGDSPEDICSKNFGAGIRVLQATLDNLDCNDIKLVAERIAEAKELVIFGTGGSQMVAKDAQHKFLKIGKRAVVHGDIDMQLMSASLMDKEDVALCISFSGANRSLLNCIKTAKENGAFTVGIISEIKSPIVRQKLLDVLIYAAHDETIFKSESVSTRFAQLAVIDSIVSMVAFDKYDTSLKSIRSTRSATSHNKV